MNTNIFSCLAHASISSYSAGKPYRSTGKTAFGFKPCVRASDIACCRLSVSIVKSLSISTKKGVAPHILTAAAVAAKVKAGTNTASPIPIFSARNNRASASVPLAQVIVSLSSLRFFSCASSSATSGPRMNLPWAITRSILFFSKSEISSRCATKSIKGTACGGMF